MAQRHRDIVPTIADRENIHAKLPKAHKSVGLSRRPALDEVSNIINGKPVAVKKEPIKELKPILKNHVVKNEVKKDPIQDSKSYSSAQLDPIIKQDAETVRDPQMVCEYLEDIFEYLRNYEQKFPICENFLEGHNSSSRMRAILVNWLVQVHTNFGLCLETLHLCVSIIDRYLQDNKHVGRESLQLVGTAALLVASKYEEMYLPELVDFVYICDNTFSAREILKMEKSILMSLDYNLGKPLSIHFLRRYSKLAQVRLEQHNLSKYVLELALLDHTLSSVKPSLQAVAACCLSMAILNGVTCPTKVWTPQLAHSTGYSYNSFKHVVCKFAYILLNANSSKHKYIPNKYGEAKYNKISTNPKLKGSLVKRLAELAQKA